MSVAKSTARFAFGTFLSRITGLIRDRELGAIFGSSVLDIFMVAYRIPNLFRDMLAEGALGSSFTKVYAATSAKSREQADALMVQSIVLSSILAIAVSLLGILTAPFWLGLNTVMGVGSGRTELFLADCLNLTKYLFPYLGLTMISAIVSGALHKHSKMFLSAISPVALNLGFIAGAWFLKDFRAPGKPGDFFYVSPTGLFGLTLGVLAGATLQLVWQLWGLRTIIAEVLRRGFSLEFWNKDVRQIFTLMVPMVIAASSAQINVLVNTNFALTLENGTVTWLSYAFRLLHLPVGIFGVAIGVSVLPSLAQVVAKAGGKADAEVSSQLQSAVELILWLMVPVFVFLFLNSPDVVTLVYAKGAFGPHDIGQTAAALKAYAFSAVGYGLIKALTPFYYAIDKTSFAMRVSLIGIIINLLANMFFVKYLGMVGIAYTLSVLLAINSGQLFWQTRKEGVSWDSKKLLRHISFLGIASLGYLALHLVLSKVLNLPSLFLKHPLAQSFLSLAVEGFLLLLTFSAIALVSYQLSPQTLFTRLKQRLR